MNRHPAVLRFLAIVCLSAAPATAQDVRTEDPPAHISFVDGSAVLERDGRSDSDLQSMPLLAGDRVRTQSGRVEVLFADNSVLHLDSSTVVDFQSDEVVRLLEGRIRLGVAGPARDISYRIDAPSAWVQITDPGEYRVGVLRDGEVELAVLRGNAELINEQGRTYIRAGERTFARAGAAPSPPYVFNSAAWDSFDQWSEARRDQRLGVSAQYLPNDVRRYSPVLDNYGSWQYEQTYGYVWYPRVSVGWRPYHHGRWVSLRPYGWTWIAGDPWGWPTHHYGRWGFSAGAWFWIPGRVWGPAWVSWGYAPGYVSWCPLGWNNRPVFSIVNANLFGGRYYNPWHAWTVVPRHHFGGAYVNVRSIPAVRIDQRIHDSFVVRDNAPDVRSAVGRSAAPIRTAGHAVPRPGTYGATVPTLSTAGGSAAAATSDRRFPAPAREPRIPTTRIDGQSTVSGARAVSRDRGAVAGDPSRSPRIGDSTPTNTTSDGVVSPRYRRAPDGAAPQRNDASTAAPAITAPPAGAVRAVPRSRDASEFARPDAGISAGDRNDRARSRSYSAPASPTPDVSPQPSTRSTGDVPRYQSEPTYRTVPDTGNYRGRAAPRDDASAPARAPSREEQPAYRSAPAAPSQRSEPPPMYRSAPERQAPSTPPPSAAPAPRSGGDERRGNSGNSGNSGDGGGHRRGGGNSSSGGGTARRR